MSAIPEQFVNKTARVSEAVTRPFPNSRKIYVRGSRPDILVPMREIGQSETPSSFGAEVNPPIPVYDTSGPYTDPEVTIDLLKGLPDVRSEWIRERGDTEVLAGPSSEYGRQRANDPKLASLRSGMVLSTCSWIYEPADGCLAWFRLSLLVVRGGMEQV